MSRFTLSDLSRTDLAEIVENAALDKPSVLESAGINT